MVIYNQNVKLDRIDIVRSKTLQKLTFSLVGKANSLEIKSSYENTKNINEKKFNELKLEIEQYLFKKLEKVENFVTILDGITINFVNLK